jgi:PAS domain S-box-containing protein
MVVDNSINILYIEDDEASAKVIERLLERSVYTKFNIIHKGNIKDALEYCEHIDPHLIDVVLLDLVLPNSCGIDTFLTISKKCNSIPIIIISGYEDLAYQCVRMGAQDYLIKSELSGSILKRSIKYAIERTKTEKVLRQSEKKYRNIVEIAGAGIFSVDYTTGKFTYVNNVLCKQLGWSQEELLNMGPADVLVKSSMDIFIERQEAMARGIYIDNVIEYEARRKDGSTFWGLVTSEYIQDENKNVISGNAISIDITSLKLAEEALKKRENKVYIELEGRIREWKEEIIIRNVNNEQHLALIDSEILSMNGASEAF